MLDLTYFDNCLFLGVVKSEALVRDLCVLFAIICNRPFGSLLGSLTFPLDSIGAKGTLVWIEGGQVVVSFIDLKPVSPIQLSWRLSVCR
jgi:hypothetical protein